MAEKAKEEEQTNEKMIKLINSGKHNFRTSGGTFGPGDHVTVPEAEAGILLRYHGVVDAAKYAPPTSEHDELRKKHDHVTAENEKHVKRIAKLEKALAKHKITVKDEDED